MKTIDIIQRLSLFLFTLMLVAPAEVENSSNRAVVATTIYFREEGQETCYVYETVKLNIYRK